MIISYDHIIIDEMDVSQEFSPPSRILNKIFSKRPSGKAMPGETGIGGER
jgi:hypothetical protein